MAEREHVDIWRLQKEVEFYKRQCNDLGVRILKAQEDYTSAIREARRSRAVSKLVREAYLLADFGGPAADIDHVLLSLVVENAMCDRGMWLQERVPGSSQLDVVCALGIRPPTGVLAIGRPPAFLYTTGSARPAAAAADLMATIQAPFILWGYDPRRGTGLLLGNLQESNANRPFEPGDEDLVQTALHVYADAVHRKAELSRPWSDVDTEDTGPEPVLDLAPADQESSGIREADIQSGLAGNGRITGLFVVDRSAAGDLEFVCYVRGSWSRHYQILRKYRDRGDRTYRDLARLIHLARHDFGFSAPIVTYEAGMPELRHFPGVCQRDLAPYANNYGSTEARGRIDQGTSQ